ncbi:hypothetical protein G6F37_004836 [Rhizopus arrhizus]|nr:hypothetical protein G6F38_010786 [Rhizopus arrhizus]KAG1159497.1 hypothetical protein G6F37_004836 [Rhizopus arrhizus]
MIVDFVTRTILGTTNSDEPFNFTYDSTKKQRKKTEKISRQELIQDGQYQQKANVTYGDVSVCGTYRGHTPIPVKIIQRAIATKAINIPMGEFRTSIAYSHYYQRLENVFDEPTSLSIQ